MRVIFILLLFVSITCVGQKNTGLYANAKAGITNWAGDNSRVALSFEMGLLRNNNMFVLSYLRSEEISERDIINTIDVTLGRFNRKNNFVFHYQAGIGPVWSADETDTDKKFVTFGLPLKTGIKFVPPNFFSFGLDLQANVNPKQSMYMIMLTVGMWPANNQ